MSTNDDDDDTSYKQSCWIGLYTNMYFQSKAAPPHILWLTDWVDGVSLSRPRHYHKVNTKAGDEFYLKYLQLVTCLRRGMNSITPTTIVSIDRLVLNNNINIMQLCRYISDHLMSFAYHRSSSTATNKIHIFNEFLGNMLKIKLLCSDCSWNGIYSSSAPLTACSCSSGLLKMVLLIVSGVQIIIYRYTFDAIIIFGHKVLCEQFRLQRIDSKLYTTENAIQYGFNQTNWRERPSATMIDWLIKF